MKIIFLDIDGVLNCETAYENGYCKYVDVDTLHYQQFYPPSKNFINSVIQKTNAKIVISSTWRHSGLEKMKNIWSAEKMAGEIIDITPSFNSSENYGSIPRGIEIDAWLRNKGFYYSFWSEETQNEYMKKSNIENYLIIDDDSDMLYNQKNHFVRVLPSPRNKEGFNLEHSLKSIEILSKDIFELNKDLLYY